MVLRLAPGHSRRISEVCGTCWPSKSRKKNTRTQDESSVQLYVQTTLPSRQLVKRVVFTRDFFTCFAPCPLPLSRHTWALLSSYCSVLNMSNFLPVCPARTTCRCFVRLSCDVALSNLECWSPCGCIIPRHAFSCPILSCKVIHLSRHVLQ